MNSPPQAAEERAGDLSVASSRLPVIILIVFYTVVVLKTAWISDDAYITFRTIDNFSAGFGLTWNTDERVQTYTHPLWLLLLAALHLVTHEIYYTSLCVSVVCSVAAALLYANRVATTPIVAAIGLTILTCSKAYADYSTSGLENPLTHLLLALFFASYLSPDPITWRRIVYLGAIAACAMLTHMDTILLYLPALLHVLRRRMAAGVGAYLVGFAPFVLWEAFSLFYYGVPVPNTAYAKLGAGIPGGELLVQGAYYFLNSMANDPMTLIIIGAAVASAFTIRDARAIAIALGVIAYLGYTLLIGGDFMGGRYFSAPLLCGVIALSRAPEPGFRTSVMLLIVIGLIGISAPRSPLYSTASYGTNLGDEIDKRGVADERAVYYVYTGLLKSFDIDEFPQHPWAREGREARRAGESLIAKYSVGLFGYCAGPKVHVVDQLGLGDALLARIPKAPNDGWRIGHVERRLPDGYLESLRSGENRVNDPDLAQYYDRLRFIITGPLFSMERLRETLRFNLGEYDHWLQAYIRRANPSDDAS